MQIKEEEFVRYLTIKKRLAPKTVDTYRIRFLVVKRWLEANKAELTKYTFETYLYELKQKGLSNAALNTYIQTIKHLEGFCKDRDLPTGFTEGIEHLPKTHPEIVILSLEEIERLLTTHLEYKNRNGVDCSSLDQKYLTLTSFIAITGCRFEEAASLIVKRLDISNGRATLVNTKNKRNRFVFFEGEIKSQLLELINNKSPEDLVFTNSRETHVKPGEFNNDLRLRAEKAGITKYVHAHLLRHSFGTHLVVAGVDISMVASILGHKDIQTTYETYVHLADDTLQRAAMKHPMMRKNIEPTIILEDFKQAINSFKLNNDSRFAYSLKESNGSISVNVLIKR